MPVVLLRNWPHILTVCPPDFVCIHLYTASHMLRQCMVEIGRASVFLPCCLVHELFFPKDSGRVVSMEILYNTLR